MFFIEVKKGKKVMDRVGEGGIMCVSVGFGIKDSYVGGFRNWVDFECEGGGCWWLYLLELYFFIFLMVDVIIFILVFCCVEVIVRL